MFRFGSFRSMALVVVGLGTFGAHGAFAQDAAAQAQAQAQIAPLPLPLPLPAPMPVLVQTQVQNQTQALGANGIGPVNTIAQGQGSLAITPIRASNQNSVLNRTPIDTVVLAPRGGRLGPVAVSTAVQNSTAATGLNQIGPVNTLALGNGSTAVTAISASNQNSVRDDTRIRTIIGR